MPCASAKAKVQYTSDLTQQGTYTWMKFFTENKPFTLEIKDQQKEIVQPRFAFADAPSANVVSRSTPHRSAFRSSLWAIEKILLCLTFCFKSFEKRWFEVLTPYVQTCWERRAGVLWGTMGQLREEESGSHRRRMCQPGESWHVLSSPRTWMSARKWKGRGLRVTSSGLQV